MMRIANAQVWVHDQDEALAFYTQKLGWEVRADVTVAEMGDFRWLAVAPPGQEDFALVLMAVPPHFEPETRRQIEAVMSKGVSGGIFVTTDDVRTLYDDLQARGVEFTDPLEERPYGIDTGLRDPSGNSLRLTQLVESFAA